MPEILFQVLRLLIWNTQPALVASGSVRCYAAPSTRGRMRRFSRCRADIGHWHDARHAARRLEVIQVQGRQGARTATILSSDPPAPGAPRLRPETGNGPARYRWPEPIVRKCLSRYSSPRNAQDL
jgi:hypothetical protein